MICDCILNLGMCNLYCIWMPDYFHSLKSDLLSVSRATALHQEPIEARFFEPWFAAHLVSTHHVKQNQGETRKPGAVNCLAHIDKRNKETRAALDVYDCFYTRRKPERPERHSKTQTNKCSLWSKLHHSFHSICRLRPVSHLAALLSHSDFFSFEFNRCFASSFPHFLVEFVH